MKIKEIDTCRNVKVEQTLSKIHSEKKKRKIEKLGENETWRRLKTRNSLINKTRTNK